MFPMMNSDYCAATELFSHVFGLLCQKDQTMWSLSHDKHYTIVS